MSEIVFDQDDEQITNDEVCFVECIEILLLLFVDQRYSNRFDSS